MSAIWVEVLRTRGSAPRDAGAAMRVTVSGSEGTIGGGELEFRAIQRARNLLAQGKSQAKHSYALGPELGQCCGGAVTLNFSSSPRPGDAPPLETPAFAAPDEALGPLWIWGAGHVGRAVVTALPPGAFEVTWVDTDPSRFPARLPEHATCVPAADMPWLARRAPADAQHLIFTYSHEIDLALCDALLRRGFKSCGLIGSATKWARFRSRLQALGQSQANLGRITCPIGDPSLGKEPRAIANGVVARLLSSAKMDRRD